MLAAEYLRITVLGGLLVRVFLAAAPPSISRLDQVRVDGLVLLFTPVVAAVAGILAGVIRGPGPIGANPWIIDCRFGPCW